MTVIIKADKCVFSGNVGGLQVDIQLGLETEECPKPGTFSPDIKWHELTRDPCLLRPSSHMRINVFAVISSSGHVVLFAL